MLNKSKVIAFCNQKGGVGKTTTAFNVAREYVRRNKTVLVVDLDEQANLTNALVVEDSMGYTDSVADLLMTSPLLKTGQVILKTIWENCYILPSGQGNMSAALASMAAENAIGAEFRLRKALDELPDDLVDVIIIDCGPAINRLTTNALVAASDVILVSQSQLYSAVGLTAVAGAALSIKENYNNALNIAGIVVNQHRKNTKDGENHLAMIVATGSEFGIPVLRPTVPDRQQIRKTISERKGLDEMRAPYELIDIYKRYVDTLEKVEKVK